MSKPLTRRERSIAAKYRRILKAEEKAASQYELVDRLKFQIAQLAGGHGHVARISADGKALKIISPMQAAIEHPERKPNQMPKAWAHAAVRAFDLKEVLIPLEA